MKKSILIAIIVFLSCKTAEPYNIYSEIDSVIEDIDSKSWEQAENKLSELLTKDTTIAEIYFHRAFVKQNQLKYQESILDFTKAIELDPSIRNARTNRGYSYRMLGQYNQAIIDYKAEQEINPNPYSDEHIAMVYIALEELDKAFRHVNLSIKQDSLNSIAYKTRALIFRKKNMKDKACQDLSKAIQLKIVMKYPKYQSDITSLNKYCHEIDEK